jgi:hypothetical protein
LRDANRAFWASGRGERAYLVYHVSCPFLDGLDFYQLFSVVPSYTSRDALTQIYRPAFADADHQLQWAVVGVLGGYPWRFPHTWIYPLAPAHPPNVPADAGRLGASPPLIRCSKPEMWYTLGYAAFITKGDPTGRLYRATGKQTP